MARYSYETKGNGFTLEIFRHDDDGTKTSVYFAQGEGASTVIEEIESQQSDYWEQAAMSNYDYSHEQ